MEIRHLKLIQTVAETKNLTRAAERLFLSQSALSHQLRELEEEFQTQVFVRSKKQMLLTPAGERLLAAANKVLCELKKAECEINRMTKEDEGVLRLTTGCYTCYHWLSPVLKKYKHQYPNVAIEIAPDATYSPFDYLLSGEIDLVLTSEKIPDPNLHFRSVFDDELVAVVAPEHPWAARKRIRPLDFERETLIMYSVPEPNSTILNEFFKPSGVRPANILQLNLTEAIIEMVKAEMGAAILAEWAVQPHRNRGEVTVLPLDKTIRRTWYIVSLKNLKEPPYMQAFVRLIEKARPFQGAEAAS